MSISSGGDTEASQPKSGLAPRAALGQGVKGVTASAAGASGESPWGTFGIEGVVPRYWKRGACWNDTFTSTWTSVDPISTLGDPSRANPYAYAGGNPLNATDPIGLDVWNDIAGVFLGVVVGGVCEAASLGIPDPVCGLAGGFVALGVVDYLDAEKGVQLGSLPISVRLDCGGKTSVLYEGT